MRTTRTINKDASMRRTDTRLWLVRLFAFVLLVGGTYLVYQERLHFVRREPPIHSEITALPLYALYSFLRMLTAYAFSFLFALLYGFAAAKSKTNERIMLPILDILQSVPVLGFFPAAVFFFINLAHGHHIGIEMASVFLIFTSQAWNITFGVYEALTTIPHDLREAVEAFRLNPYTKFQRLLFPACVPKLVYNSILSWAGGWYFLIACEIIAVGPANFKLRGLGAFLMRVTESGNLSAAAAGLVVLITLIVLLDVFVWRPLTGWSDKFKYEFAASTVRTRQTFGLRFWRRVWRVRFLRRTVRAIVMGLDRFAERIIVFLWNRLTTSAWQRAAKPARWVGTAILAGGVLWGLVWATTALGAVFAAPVPSDAHLIPLAILASIGRLAVAYFISLAWTLPVAAAIGRSEKASDVLTPIFQIAASVPATALFPLIVFVLVRLTGGMNVAAIALILTGMQWYLLFNLIAGVRGIPGEIQEAARSMNLKGALYWRRILLPGVFPSLVTGSVTGWGGGWNALIVSEYVVYSGTTYTAFGIGAMLSQATYQSGRSALILLSLLSMVAVITLSNHFVWRRLYAVAASKYNFDS